MKIWMPSACRQLSSSLQNVVLLVEGLEQPPQPIDVRQLGEPHEVGLPGDDVLDLPLGRRLEHLLRDVDGVLHQLIHVLRGSPAAARSSLARTSGREWPAKASFR